MPKKKGAKKGGKVVDGIATNEMSREQLLGHIKRIQAELDREREERNFFMLERVKLFSLWNLSQEQIATEKDRSRYMEVLISESQSENDEKLNIYRQKLRYMMAEQTKILGYVRLQHLRKMKKFQDEIHLVRKVLGESLEGKKKELEKTQFAMSELIRNMEMKHSQQLVTLRNDFISEVCSIESTFERKLFEKNKNEDLTNKLAIEEMGNNKRSQVDALNTLHGKQLAQLSTYYNQLTVDNFAVIVALHYELEGERSIENKLTKKLDILRNSYHSLVENFRELQEKLESLEIRTRREAKTNGLLKSEMIHMKLIKNESQLHVLEINNEALIEKVNISESEREAMRSALLATVLEIQKKKAMRIMVDELKTKGPAAKYSPSTEDFEFLNLDENIPTETIEKDNFNLLKEQEYFTDADDNEIQDLE